MLVPSAGSESEFTEKGFSIMCKKLCLAVGAVIVGLVVIAVSPRLSAVVSDSYKSMKTWMDTVPPEKQLDQLKAESEKIDQDIKKNLGKLAVQEVETERLERDLNGMKEAQASLREEITAMSKALDKDTKVVAYKDKNYAKSDLTLKLESKVNDYETRKAQIKSRELVVAAKRQSLELTHKRIREMRTQKEEIRVTITKLEARIENVKLKQVDCPVSMDDSKVSNCHAIADKLDRQLAVMEHEAELNRQYGFTKDKESNSSVRTQKSTDDVLQAAKKALQDDDDDTKAVVEKK